MELNQKNKFSWEIVPKIPVTDSYSLALVYTPGVGSVSTAIAENTDESFALTNRMSSVAVISRKKICGEFEGVDGYAFVVDADTAEKLFEIVINLAPTFGGFLLEGLSDEERDKIKSLLENESFNLPVFFDRQELQQKFNRISGESNRACLEEIKGDSLGEKSIELHRLTRGVIKVAYNPAKQSYMKPIAIISDGSAVLGLGNIGAEAALPVMEGKSVLFKTLGNVDAIPVCLRTQDSKELIDIITRISGGLSGINLEDISAPRCFEIENTLIEKLDIPVFHDDQHGTAVVVLAGFVNALKLTSKKAGGIKVVVNGAGAGAIAVSKLLIKYGVKNLILCDRTGAIFEGRAEGMNPFKAQMAEITNPDKEKGQLADVIRGADFFIGLSSANAVSKEMVQSMADKAVVFALANPVPEIMPDVALEAGAFIVATGRSDFKNQVNNSLAFPGIFRGTLDAGARKITDDMKLAAARAIAELVTADELSPEYIIPHALDLRVAPAVARAVAEVATTAGLATGC